MPLPSRTADDAPGGPDAKAERPHRLLLVAAGLADGGSVRAFPGAVLLDVDPSPHRGEGLPPGTRRAAATVLAAGSPSDVRSHPLAVGSERAELPNSVLIPGLVNAHTHLDLTHVGPRPFDPCGGFMGWIDDIRRARASEPGEIAASTRGGIGLALAGGTVAVGDIAGAPRAAPSVAPWTALRDSPLAGVSFLEFFAIGTGEERGRRAVAAALDAAPTSPRRCARLGLQPHAPNTVSPDGYEWASELGRDRGLPLATHAAETAEEHEFIARGTGPQRELLESLGLWDACAAAAVGHGASPLKHLRPVLERSCFLLAHVNGATDEDLSILADTGQSVAYCPRAAAYFGNSVRLGPHRYREMLDRGINVALGTDSIVNLPPGEGPGGVERFSVLDEMRELYRRDGTDAGVLLRMATVGGARALGLHDSGFLFEPGAVLAGLVCVAAEGPSAGAPRNAEAIFAEGAVVRPLIVGNSL